MIPIPAWLVAKVGETAAKVIAWALAALLAIGICVGIYSGVKRFFVGSKDTEIKVDQAQTNAAFESGAAAVGIVGNRQAAEQAGADNVQEAQHAIDNATDPAGVSDAGLAGLHRVQRKTPGGVQQ